MLFVSRYIGYGNYGVVDTDDGTEEIAGIGMIIRAARSGVDIKGVIKSGFQGASGGALVDDVVAYQ